MLVSTLATTAEGWTDGPPATPGRRNADGGDGWAGTVLDRIGETMGG
jgi:hypothetical protein